MSNRTSTNPRSGILSTRLPLAVLLLVGLGALAQSPRGGARPIPEPRPVQTPSPSPSPTSASASGSRSSSSPARTSNATPVQYRHASSAIIPAGPLPRCTEVPTINYWRTRQKDVMSEIQQMARKGHVAVTPVTDDVQEVTGVSEFPAGWKAYGFVVPGKGKLHVRLHHPNEGWFRLVMVNKWNSLEQGMLQNVIYTGNPEVSYINPTDEARAVYVIVDDPGWMSSKNDPFKLALEKNWEPGTRKLDKAPLVQGIWAARKDEETPKPDAPKTEPAAPEEKKG